MTTTLRSKQCALSGTHVDGDCLAFPDEHFDVVYCHTVLQFTPRPERMLAEIHRVLEPGCHAIVKMQFMRKVATKIRRPPTHERFEQRVFMDEIG